ncbi:MAG: hypothetical protein SGJ11_17195 [Phycisphaerae bacterium]|nr:hypothetical protein [Phycisphaerae bacterium]
MTQAVQFILRTTALVVALGVVTLGGLYLWSSSREAELRLELSRLEATMKAEIAAREAMITRLSRSHRKARVEVLSQVTGPDGWPSQRDSRNVLSTTVRFIEVDDDGRELGRREFTVPGDMLFIDGWTARFPKEVVAEGNPLRDRTILLFRRIYSDRLMPAEGFPIDTPGAIPDGYAGTEKLRFEQAVWQGFWKLASDPEAARRAGIAVAQGEAVYKPVRAGESYDVFVDAAAGLTLVPVDGTRVNAAGSN